METSRPYGGQQLSSELQAFPSSDRQRKNERINERKKVNYVHDVITQKAWPEDTPLRDKLYGDLAALQRTAAFVRATGVPVLQSTKKE